MLAAYAPPATAPAPDAPPLRTEALAGAPAAVSPLDGRDPAYAFRLTNATHKTYAVSRVEASCGCVAAALSGSAGGDAPLILPVTLAPGRSLTVRASVRLSDLLPGPFRKTITIYGRIAGGGAGPAGDAAALSGAEPLARVEIAGTLAPPVLFAREGTGPRGDAGIGLALGRVAASAPAGGGFVLVATPDPRLLVGTGSGVPPLVSSHPAVAVTAVPGGDSKSGLRSSRDLVRVSARAPLGPFLATLSFAPAPESGRGGGGSAWRSARVLVSGEVVGDLAASPSLVTFVLTLSPASLPPAPAPATDLALTRQIVVTTARPEVWAGLTVRAADPFVRAELLPAGGTSAGSVRRLLVITLSPDVYRAPPSRAPPAAPGGSAFGGDAATGADLRSRVTLALSNGQTVIIPVSVYRIAPPSRSVAGQK